MPRDSATAAAAERVAVQRGREIDCLKTWRNRERDCLQGRSSTEALWMIRAALWLHVEKIINDPKLDGLLDAMAVHNASGEAARREEADRRREEADRRHWWEEAARRRLTARHWWEEAVTSRHLGAEVTFEGLEEETHHEHEYEPKTKLSLRPFLLTPKLHQLLVADARRKQALSASSGLAGQPADVRKDLNAAARLAARLAKLLEHLPHPHVALAPMDPDEKRTHALISGTETLHGGRAGTRIVPASQLLRDLARALKAMQVADTGQRLHAPRDGTREDAELQRYVVHELSKLFVEQLGERRDADVAALVELLGGLPIGVEAVKKMRQRAQVASEAQAEK